MNNSLLVNNFQHSCTPDILIVWYFLQSWPLVLSAKPIFKESYTFNKSKSSSVVTTLNFPVVRTVVKWSKKGISITRPNPGFSSESLDFKAICVLLVLHFWHQTNSLHMPRHREIVKRFYIYNLVTWISELNEVLNKAFGIAWYVDYTGNAIRRYLGHGLTVQIGRASCRERV